MKKNMFSLRTKAEVIIIAFILIGISALNVMSVTRTITDTSDTFDTYIRNSNGGYWDVTEANLELAINDVGTTGYVSIGDDITITSEIDMDGHDGVFLNFNYNIATLSGDISFINFTDCNYAGLLNVDIRVSTQTGSIIMAYAENDANRVDYLTINNVNIQNTGGTYGSGPWSYSEHNFTGIELFGNAVGATGRIFEADISNVVIEGPDVGILIKTGGAGYVNGCDFYHIYAEQPVTAVEFIELASTNGANSNSFYSLRTQTARYSEYGLENVSGNSNNFYNMLLWDWNIAEAGVYSILIASGATTTYIEDTAWQSSLYTSDNGLGTTVVSGNRKLYYDADYDYKVTKNGTTYYARLGEFGDMPVSGSYDKNTDFQALMSNILAFDDIVVKLGEGVFYPDTFIPFGGKNITIEGTGDHTTIIRCESGSAYASGLFALTDEADSNATFRNIVFDGTGSSGTSVGIYFSTNDPIHGLTVEDCIFINFDAGTSRAIRISPGSDDIAQNIQIINCEFYNSDYGISLDGDNDPSLVQYADISHNYFQECLYSISCDWVRNSTISNNRIISTVASSDGITLDDSIDIIVSNNIIIVANDNIIEIGNSNSNQIYGNLGYSSEITSDNKDTMIHNSNGKYWSATGTNIQVAIDDLTSGGVVYLPSANISISVALTVAVDNITIEGQGESTILYLVDSSDSHMITVGGDIWTIKNLVMDGNGANQGAGNWFGIFIDAKYNTTIEHVGITRVDKAAIRTDTGTNYVNVLNCDIYNNNENGFESVNGGTNHVKIINSDFIDNAESPISDEITINSVDWLISDCSIINNGYRVKLMNIDNVRVENCYFKDNGGPSGETDGSLDLSRCNYSVISDCSVEGSYGWGITLNGCTHVDITNVNAYDNNAGGTATIQDDTSLGGSLESTFITITGGTYKNGDATYVWILQDNPSRITFNGVRSTDETNGIFIGNGGISSYINIIGCIFADISGSGIGYAGSGQLINSSISNNIFENCGKGIDFDDADDITILNNRFIDCTTPIDVNNAAVVRPMIMGNNWYGCTNNATTGSATGELITCNIDNIGGWWTTGDTPN